MPPYGPFVQRAPMTFSPVSHSVGRRFDVPSAVRGRECLHSSTYNQAGVFLFHDFSKRIGERCFLRVALLADKLYQRVWARPQIADAESRFYCPECVPATLAAKRQSDSDLSCRSSPLVPFVIYDEIGGRAENRGAASGSTKSARYFDPCLPLGA